MGHPAEMGIEEHSGGHCAPGPPTPVRVPLPAGAHGPWEHHGREETQHSSQQSTGQRGKQEHSAELALFEAKLGVRKAQQSPTPGISTGWGSSSSTDVGESTNILPWKAAEQAIVAVEGGRKGNPQLQAEGREGCQLWEWERAWQDVTGEGTDKITTYQKGQRAWECSAD